MKKYIYIFLISLLLIGTGCAMFKHEAERSIKKDIKEYMDANFDSYAKTYHNKKREEYKKHAQWIVGMLASGLGGIATAVGLYTISRKMKKKKNEDG